MTVPSEKTDLDPATTDADALTETVPAVAPKKARWKNDGARGTQTDVDAPSDDGTATDAGSTTVVKRRLGGRSQRFEARKVHRLIRHIDPWSTAKFALVFFLAMWVMMMVAALIVWSIAERAGTIQNIESFLQGLGLKEATIDGRFYVRGLGLVGLVLTFAFSAASIVAAMVFNLISDIIGGIWITVIEEESARPVSGSPDPSDVG